MQFVALPKYNKHKIEFTTQTNVFQYYRARNCIGLIERKARDAKPFGIELYTAPMAIAAYIHPPDEQILNLVRHFFEDAVSLKVNLKEILKDFNL